MVMVYVVCVNCDEHEYINMEKTRMEYRVVNIYYS